MAVPSSYTETSLADFMHATLSKVALSLGFTSPDSYDEAVNETLLTYGVTNISLATDVRKLRTLAIREAWQAAANAAAAFVDTNTEGAQFNMTGLHKQILTNLQRAEIEAMRYNAVGYVVGITRVKYTDTYNTNQETE